MTSAAEPPADPTAVRAMDPDEYAAMRELSVAAFGGDATIRRLIDGLHASWAWEDALSFVAIRGDEIVGQALYTHAVLDAPGSLVDVLVLSPVGVRPALQGRGIGTRLLTASLAALEDRTEPLVFLEGDPRYYRRFGWRRAVELGFVAPSVRIPTEAFQVYALPAFDRTLTGALVYPDAFWRADAVGLRVRFEQHPPAADVMLRDATPGDLDRLQEVFRSASLSNTGDRPHLLAHPEVLEVVLDPIVERRMRVAVVDERIVGFATIQPGDGAAELDDLFVDPSWMRHGIGRLLVQDAVASARASGATRIEVTANEHALAFYEAAGFVRDGTAATQFGMAPRMHLEVPIEVSGDPPGG